MSLGTTPVVVMLGDSLVPALTDVKVLTLCFFNYYSKSCMYVCVRVCAICNTGIYNWILVSLVLVAAVLFLTLCKL